MNSTVIQFCLSDAKGGLELSALKLARDFKHKGLRSVCISRTHSFLAQATADEGIESFTVNPQTTYFNPNASLRLRALFKQLKPQVIFVHSLRDLWILYPATRGLKSTKIIGLAHMFVKNVNKKDLLHRRIYSQLDHLIVMTKAQQAELQKCLPLEVSKYVLIPNGVDTQKFSPTADRSTSLRMTWNAGPDDIVIGYVGRLDPMKGVFELMAAAEQLQNLAHLKFVMIGDDTLPEAPTKAKLEQQISNLGLKNIKILPFRQDIQNIMGGFDIFVMPSHEESFGLVLIEAMASGLPCISTQAGGPPEILSFGEVGVLVTPGSAEELTKAIKDLAHAPDRRKNLGEKARKKAVDTYDSLTIFEKIKTLSGL